MTIPERILLALSVLTGRPRYDLGQKAVTRHVLKSHAATIVLHDQILQDYEYTDWYIGVMAAGRQHAMAVAKVCLLEP